MNKETTGNVSRAPKKPRGKFSVLLISLLVTLAVGLVFFYLTLPALNFQSPDFIASCFCCVSSMWYAPW